MDNILYERMYQAFRMCGIVVYSAGPSTVVETEARVVLSVIVGPACILWQARRRMVSPTTIYAYMARMEALLAP